MNDPLISVIIPIYNQERYLSATLESVMHQTYQNLEIILIDDGSTDGTTLICRKYADQDARIRVITQSNKGPAAARNQGILAAKGEWICLLDADDIMDRERIVKQYAVFKADPTIDVVYTALKLIDQEGLPIGEMHSQDYPAENFLAEMLFRNRIPTSSLIMAKRECFADLHYNEKFSHAEDYELMIRLAHHYRFKYIDLPLTSYRRHQHNLSNNLASHREAEQKVLQQYDPAQIAQIVSQTTLAEEEKNLLLGKIFFKKERIHEALEIFKELSSGLAQFYAGNCHLYLQQYELAEKNFRESLSNDPSNAACYNNLGVVLAFLSQNEEAISSFKQALQMKEGYLDAKYNLSHVHLPETLRITWRELRTNIIPYHQ